MFKEINPESLNDNVFKMIGKDWMLISAKHNDKLNAMTASWGGMGVMWNKNVAFIVLRPQRYTKTLLDQAQGFSLTFFTDGQRQMLNYMGSASGHNEDKISKSGLTVKLDNDLPYYEEARLVLFCNKLFAQPYQADAFIDSSILPKWYPENDLHTLYIAEITKVLIKEG